MDKKTGKNLWMDPALIARFDAVVEELADDVGKKLQTGLVGGAALLHFCNLPRVEQIETLRAFEVYLYDEAIKRKAARAGRKARQAGSPGRGRGSAGGAA